MSTIPRTRADLLELIATSRRSLAAALDGLTTADGQLRCTEDWNLLELLAVRQWWSERVLDWVTAGRRGAVPETPAPGFSWRETPKLNARIARECPRESLPAARARLERVQRRLRATIDRLDDRELLEVGVYEWAGRYPLARWLAMNTARQYKTAATMIRRARRAVGR
ncbi:MAG: ClbS/DfsB family four-helix bundle protein [bacterium]|nr:ClbS/DfsB family four-helix bundle protein [bacterium]